jgi:uncharacterized membrane protein YccC
VTARWAGGWDWRGGVDDLRANLSLDSTAGRHALRFGVALGVGTAAYWLLGLHEHGFWIPLTILFVLRPEAGETNQRLILRAYGTAIGIAIAALAFLLWSNPKSGEEVGENRPLAPPEAAAR